MASGWVKSLQCKSRAFEDVYHPNPKNLIHNVSCRRSVQSIKDVVETTKYRHRKPKAIPDTKKQRSAKESKPETALTPRNRSTCSSYNSSGGSSMSSGMMRTPDTFFPSLNELPEGHPSRNVVEIIFHTSWGPKPFTGCIEMIWKVQNGSKMASRFEEYREMVKTRSGSGCPEDGDSWEENARCVADGNEVMRFHCLGPSYGGGQYFSGGAWMFPCGKGSTICTFSGSGEAHDNTCGGRGRRAMLVCRVIAGRISNNEMLIDSLFDSRVRFDSVRGHNGELFVFDSRSVLPCFLIIYKL